jgi:hypothetical protein
MDAAGSAAATGIELSRRPSDRHCLRPPTAGRDRPCPGQRPRPPAPPRYVVLPVRRGSSTAADGTVPSRSRMPLRGRTLTALAARAAPTTLESFVLRFPLPSDLHAPHRRLGRPGRTRHALEPSCRARQDAPRPARAAASPAPRPPAMPHPGRRDAAAAGTAAGTATMREPSSRRRSTAATRCQPARAAQHSQQPTLMQPEPQLASSAARQPAAAAADRGCAAVGCSCGKQAHRRSQRSVRAGSAALHHGRPAPALGCRSPDPQESGHRDPTSSILPRGVRREVAGSGRAMELVSSGSASLQQRQASARADVPLAAGPAFSIRMTAPGALTPPSL